MDSAGLLLLNAGTSPTFSRNGGESVIDVTFCSPNLIRGARWRVGDDHLQSDHFPVFFELGVSLTNGQRTRRRRHQTRERSLLPTRAWKTSFFEKEIFAEALHTENIYGQVLRAEDLTRAVSNACDATMPRRSTARGPRKAFW